MFFSRRPRKWNHYTRTIDVMDLDVPKEYEKSLLFLNVDRKTLEDVREAANYLLPYKEEIIDKFYENINASLHLTGIINEFSTIERLKVTQVKYVEQFLAAEIDEDYVAHRTKVGMVHSHINLTPNHFIMAHNLLIQYMTTIIMEKLYKKPDTMMRYVVSIQKLAAFDQQLILEVYSGATFSGFLKGISEMINDVTKLDTSQHLIEGMNNQISETHNMTAATEEMSVSIEEVSNHAIKVAESAEDAVKTAEHSSVVIDDALRGIDGVGSIYEMVMEDVSRLQKEIEHTHNVIHVIKEIAEQTNLLALNASIEAARAGDYGKGFAVVATEVRKLSEHTQEQIEQITGNMTALQTVTEEVTSRIQETSDRIEGSVSGSKSAKVELEKIVDTMQLISQDTAQIAAMNEEQSSTVMEISTRNTNVYDVSLEVQVLAKETANVIYNVSEKMNDYRLDVFSSNLIGNEKDILQLAKTDHLLWKWKVYNLLLDLDSVTIDVAGSHEACRLGEWYYSEQSKAHHQKEAFIKLEEPHKAVHELAGRAMELHAANNISAAKEVLSELEQASLEVVEWLTILEQDLN